MQQSSYPKTVDAPDKVNWLIWPGILIALPLSVVVASAITAVFIVRHPEGLVAEDYYKQGKAINARLAKTERAHQLGFDRFEVKRTQTGVDVEFPHASTGLAVVEFTFAHPADPSQDRRFVINAAAKNRVSIPLDHPFTERRRVLVTDLPRKDWRAEAVLSAP